MKAAGQLIRKSLLVMVWGFLLVTPFGRAQAQSSTASINTETSVLPSVAAPRMGEFKLDAGLKSTNDSGRLYEYSDTNPKAKQYRLRNEYFIGTTHSSGWGVVATAVTKGSTSQERSAFGAGDPSGSIVHPAFYDDGTTKVWGMLRAYVPVTDRSKDHNVQHYAYYLLATHKMAQGWDIFNGAIGRKFLMTSPDATDGSGLIEDFTTVSKKMNSWLKLGVGQHTQYEMHFLSDAGTCIEAYPFAKFTLSANIFIEPRFYLPLYKFNYVYDTPKAVSLNNSLAEVFVSITM